jgi:prolyl-tRNA editing enzyme YbaK/EbsC (Cys-tRNA(Pro) deacylase)
MGVPRASFAAAEDTIALTGMLIGGVTVFALPPEPAVYIDARLIALDYVILGGGSRSLKVKVSPAGLEQLPNTHVVPGLGVGL